MTETEETEMEEDTAVDHAKMTHEREATKATATKRILANCGDTKKQQDIFGLSCGGFLEYSVFLPFFTRGKRFFDALSPRCYCLLA